MLHLFFCLDVDLVKEKEGDLFLFLLFEPNLFRCLEKLGGKTKKPKLSFLLIFSCHCNPNLYTVKYILPPVATLKRVTSIYQSLSLFFARTEVLCLELEGFTRPNLLLDPAS